MTLQLSSQSAFSGNRECSTPVHRHTRTTQTLHISENFLANSWQRNVAKVCLCQLSMTNRGELHLAALSWDKPINAKTENLWQFREPFQLAWLYWEIVFFPAGEVGHVFQARSSISDDYQAEFQWRQRNLELLHPSRESSSLTAIIPLTVDTDWLIQFFFRRITLISARMQLDSQAYKEFHSARVFLMNGRNIAQFNVQSTGVRL